MTVKSGINLILPSEKKVNMYFTTTPAAKFSLLEQEIKQQLSHPPQLRALVANIKLPHRSDVFHQTNPKNLTFPCNFNLLYLIIVNCSDKHNKAVTTLLSSCLDLRGLRERRSFPVEIRSVTQ